MRHVFYTHLIIIEEVEEALDAHVSHAEERAQALSLIHETLHNEIMDLILTALPRTHHTAFLAQFEVSPHDDELLTFINTHTGRDMEKEILKKANAVKKALIKDIKKHTKR